MITRTQTSASESRAERDDGGDLEAFFSPASIAFVGASNDVAKLGGRRFRSLREEGFAGQIYPVNPRSDTVQGMRAYATVAAIPGPVDLGVIVVPADQVADTVEQCLAQKMRALVVISAGFGEVSDAGKIIEQELVRNCAASGVRLMGPNCAGLFDSAAAVNIGGLQVPPGPIGLVSQSGNLVLDFARHANASGFGISRYASIGNAADVSSTDVIANLFADRATKVVLAYLEGWSANEGRRLFDLVTSHPSRKPLVVLKPGRSKAGRAAALSHTGSLAGEDRIVSAAFEQAGVHRAADPREAWELACALASYQPMAGRAVAILSDGGGHATLLADALGQAGFEVPELDQATQIALQAFLPARCTVSNPVDFAGVVEADPLAWPKAARMCLEAEGVDAVALVGHFGGYHFNGGESLAPQELAAAVELSALAANTARPLLVQSIHANGHPEALQVLRTGGVSVVRSPEHLAPILAALVVRGEHPNATRLSVVDRSASEQDFGPAKGQLSRVTRQAEGGALALLEPESRELLAAAGFEVPAWQVSADPQELARMSPADGALALKLIAPGLIHRSDVGAVALDVRGAAQVAQAAAGLLERARDGVKSTARVLSTRMIESGTEVVIGAARDPHFGPFLMFGLGGVHLEVLDDVAFALAPLTHREALQLVGAIRSHALLDGFRGAVVGNRAAAAEILVRLGYLMVACPEIAEVDLNPIFLDGTSARIADVSVVLASE